MKLHLSRISKRLFSGNSKNHEGKHKGTSDRLLAGLIVVLSVFGVLMVYDSSVALALRDFSDQYYYIHEQLKWLIIGIAGFLVASRVPYKTWYALALPFLMIILTLLVAVFIPGIGVNAQGAHRWINLGFMNVQPAEIAKFVIIIYLSAWFSNPEKNRFGAFLLLLLAVVGLIMLEPDLGTSVIILVIALSLYFFSNSNIQHFLFIVPAFLGLVVLLAVVSPYRAARIKTFFDPQHDPLGSSYQMRQVLLALGSGGWSGVGIGRSRQKYEYLPEANTDSIFAIIGEEIGFIGASAVVILFLGILWRCFRIAGKAPDTFSRLFVLGVAMWIGTQTLINLGAMVALIPLTGVPLPFVSYGGSSLIMLLIATGIVVNISTYRK